MATRIGGAAASGTTVAIPGSYQAGDMIVCYAFRDGSTAEMTDPTNGAWERQKGLSGPVGPTCIAQVYWRYAESSSESAPVVGSATGVLLEVWRGSAPYSLTLGAITASPNASTGTTITYPALTLSRNDGTSMVLRLAGARLATDLTTNTPSGYTAGTGVATEVRSCYAGPTGTDPTTGTQTVTGSSGWVAVSLELMEKLPVTIEAQAGSIHAFVAGTVSPNVNFASGSPSGSVWEPTEGDLVVLFTWSNGANNCTINAIPSGWFNVIAGGGTGTTIISSGSAFGMAVVAHFVTAGEATAATKSYTATSLFTAAGAGRPIAGYVLRGVDTTTPVDAVASVAGAASTTATAKGVVGASVSTGSFVFGLFAAGASTGSVLISPAILPSRWALLEEGTAVDVWFMGNATTSGVSVSDVTRGTSSTGWGSVTAAFTQAPPSATNTGAFFAMF
jgi:hypothetical protein